MKAIILSILCMSIYSSTNLICEGKSCRFVDINGESTQKNVNVPGPNKDTATGLLFGKYEKNQKKEAVKKGGVQGFNRNLELRFNEIKENQCYVRIMDNGQYEFMRAFHVDKKRERFYMVTENSKEEDTLENRLYFWRSKSFDRFLRFIDCEQTPNLADTKYIDNCTNTKQITSKTKCFRRPRLNF